MGVPSGAPIFVVEGKVYIMIRCIICGEERPKFLHEHILTAHGMTTEEYRTEGKKRVNSKGKGKRI
jgi:predicted transcriptional regulator